MRAWVALLIMTSCGCGSEDAMPEFDPFHAESAPVGYVDRVFPRERGPETVDLDGWQSELRERLRKHLRVHPVQSVKYRVLKTDGMRTWLKFTAFDGSEIPAILQAPDEPIGAVLVIPGHVREDESGLYQTVFDTDSYQGAAASRLAQERFTTLSFELRGFGLLNRPDHRHVAFNAIADGSSYKEVALWDAEYAFALLGELSGFNPGVAGASLGGELAAFLAALDERVSLVAISSYGGRLGIPELPRGKQRHYCHVIPGLHYEMEQQDIFKLIAPRPMALFKEHPLDDGFAEELAVVWRHFGAKDPTIEVGGEEHRFFVGRVMQFFRDRSQGSIIDGGLGADLPAENFYAPTSHGEL